jgi:hypothetical protein
VLKSLLNSHEGEKRHVDRTKIKAKTLGSKTNFYSGNFYRILETLTFGLDEHRDSKSSPETAKGEKVRVRLLRKLGLKGLSSEQGEGELQLLHERDSTIRNLTYLHLHGLKRTPFPFPLCAVQIVSLRRKGKPSKVQ